MKNIIKRIIIGTGICLLVNFLTACDVHAASLSYVPTEIKLNNTTQELRRQDKTYFWGFNYTMPQNYTTNIEVYFNFPYISGMEDMKNGTITFSLKTPPLANNTHSDFIIATAQQRHYLISNWQCSSLLTDQNGNRYCSGWWNDNQGATNNNGVVGSNGWYTYKYYDVEEHYNTGSNTIDYNYERYIIVYVYDRVKNYNYPCFSNSITNNDIIEFTCPNINIENEWSIILSEKGHAGTDRMTTYFIGVNQVTMTSNAIEESNQIQKETRDFLKDSSLPDNSSGDIGELNSNIATNGTISSLVTMPITFLQKIINGLNGSCSPIVIGELYEYNMTMPCINPQQYIGIIWNIIDVICAGFLSFKFGKKLVSIFHKITSMKDGGLEEAYD